MLPNGERPSPLKLGWTSGDWVVLEFVAMAVPAGKRRVGEPSYQPVDGRLVETYAVEDRPQPSATDAPLEAWEFHAMIAYLGKDAAIRTAIDGISDTLERAIALKRYEASRLYHRDDALLARLAGAIGMPDSEIDSAWAQIVGLR